MERRSQVEGQAYKRSGRMFSPTDWIRRILEWGRLEEEGNLRVRAFSQGWWLKGEGGGLMEEEHNFLSAASFCPTSQETGDRSGIAHPIKWPKQTRSNIQWKSRASIGFGISTSTQFEEKAKHFRYMGAVSLPPIQRKDGCSKERVSLKKLTLSSYLGIRAVLELPWC